MKRSWIIVLLVCTACSFTGSAQVADTATYLSSIKLEMQKKWPANRTINLVYHGHSVPSGYYTRGEVHTLGSYPFLALKLIKEKYKYAVINTILTSIGGEQSEKGQTRFDTAVLTMRPDVIFIDYALNDRNIGLERARSAWAKMIEAALKKNIKVVLLTPTPDSRVDILAPDNILEQHARQIRELAATYHVALVDSYLLFKRLKESGEDLEKYMAQNNHINELGHQLVAAEIAKWFN
ncbi:MAG: SGNH/GDSL hydrolase family protein [Sphingobacteriales bacterium]|nr:SGNH/GDSL hydrolase family protein [Sphingobacteriales bacterium]OJV99458.1 MAG: lipase [Sphingobacteriales bacterium 44-61]